MNNPNVLISSDYGSIIVNRYDPFLGTEISRTGYWSQSDINLIKDLIHHVLSYKNHVTLYDVGANIGTHSLALAKIFQEKIKVRSFEAQRLIYYMLCGTIALNGLQNVYAENVAVCDTNEGMLEIELPNYHTVNNFGGLELVPPLRSDNGNMVKDGVAYVARRTLDSYNEEVDFIKMDIEGMEAIALGGATRLFQASRPICFIEILKTDVDYLIQFFKNRDYVGYQKHRDLILIPKELNLHISELPQIL